MVGFENALGAVKVIKDQNETRRLISRPKMGSFLNRCTGNNQFLFHESKLFYHSIQYPKKYHPSTLGSMSNHKNCTFWVKPLITLTCRNFLINLVINKFYFGILIRVASETG